MGRGHTTLRLRLGLGNPRFIVPLNCIRGVATNRLLTNILNDFKGLNYTRKDLSDHAVRVGVVCNFT